MARFAAVLLLVAVAIASPIATSPSGPEVAVDPGAMAMTEGAAMPHEMDCCPEGGHAAGAGCAACVLAVSVAQVYTAPAVTVGLAAVGPPTEAIRLGLPEVPHGPPRFV